MENYKPYYGEEEEEKKEEEIKMTQQKLDTETALRDDPMSLYKQQISEIKKKEVLKSMLSGTIFSLRLEALRLSVYTPGMQIKR